MSRLIKTAMATANQKELERQQKISREEQEKRWLNERLENLKNLVLKEARELSGTVTKYGKLEVSTANVPGCGGFCRIVCHNLTSDEGERWDVVVFRADIKRGVEHKYSDESDPVITDDPTVFAHVYTAGAGPGMTRPKFNFEAEDRCSESIDRFFDDIGKALSFLFE